jgi:hypothetical protein
MPIAQDAGGYGGTWWSRKNVEEMWEAIANQDTTSHYKLLTGWRRSFELTFEHLTQVKNYRENLAEAWPPEKSSASAAYITRLDALIAQLQETCDKAAANHDTFAAATLALEASRNNLKPLYDEYVANKIKLAAFAAAPPDRPVGAGKYIIQAPKPPVANERQEELNDRARVIMYGLSDEIMTASAQIVQPMRYDPAASINNQGHEHGGRQYAAPSIPPIVPFSPEAPSDPTPSSERSLPPKTERQPGLVLGEYHRTPTSPSTSPTTENSPPIINGRSPSVIIPGTLSPPSPSGSSTSRPGLIYPPGTSGRLRPGGGKAPNAGARAMPPGGVIGAAPGLGIGQPATGSRPVQRVNPIGGIIQPAGSVTRPGTDERNSASPITPLAGFGSRPANREDEFTTATKHWDPDNPWQTIKGGDPVILPPAEKPIDPGPAIGLK